MRLLIKTFFVLTLMIVVSSCNETDVPISLSTNVPAKYLGVWKGESTLYTEVYRKSGNATYIKFYDEDHKIMYESPLHYMKFTDSRGSIEFVSYMDEDKSYYRTAKVSYYSFYNTAVELTFLDVNYLKDRGEKVVGNKVYFGSVSNFQNFVRRHMRYGSLYNESNKKALKKVGFVPKKLAKSCSSPTYQIRKLNQKSYNRNLGVWEDWSGWKDVSSQYNSIRFYDKGISLKMNGNSLDMKYIRFSQTKNGYHVHTGSLIAKGERAGTVYFGIKDFSYDLLAQGEPCSIDFYLQISSATSSWDQLINGSDGFIFYAKANN